MSFAFNPTAEDAGAARDPREALQRIRQEIDRSLGDLVRQTRRPALLEFPAHPNVGDSAIWLGEIAFLDSRHRRQPIFTSDIDSYSPARLASVRGLDAILIHGGGNLGDLWKGPLESKIRVLQDSPDVPVIQLPQTIYFRDQRRLDEYRRAVAAHRRFTLLVRDRPSFEMAKATFDCEVRLCPDMALWLDLERPVAARHEVTCLLRVDLEASPEQRGWRDAAPADLPVVDWLDEPDHWLIGMERWLNDQIALRPRRLARLERLLVPFRNRVAANRVRRGCRLLASGKTVVTDRLHAHILCLLMGIPHVVLDNSYGKVSQFYATWTRGFPGVRFAGSLGEAVELARDLAKASE